MCPLCRAPEYDSKPFVEGQKRYLIRQLTLIQALGRGFLQRNAYYMLMKDSGYKPQHPDIKKRFIGFKLGLISKKQRYDMH
jgi:hypothetical protein